jgi:hypothetical protein
MFPVQVMKTRGNAPVVVVSALLCIVLGGCAALPPASGIPVGYRYQDGNHPGGIAQASPQALYNAAHGVWLWPPQETDWP